MQAPTNFFRVQCAASHTQLDDQLGFYTGTHINLPVSYRMDKPTFQRQLDGNNRQPNGFIAMFSDIDAARNTACFMVHMSHRNVKIHHISAQLLQPTHLPVISQQPGSQNFSIFPLRVLWRDPEPLVFYGPDFCALFNIQAGSEMHSQWFALDYIPRDMIVGTVDLYHIDCGGYVLKLG